MAHQSCPEFGELVREARLKAGLTQEELAERAGLSVRGISDLERGLVRSPRRETLAMLAESLGLFDDERSRWEELRQRLAVRSLAVRSGRKRVVAPAGRLPNPLTSFVGRQREQADVATLLGRPDVRLLTITGPGGVGKTRLAITVADQLRSDYPDGVRFIDLVPVQDSNQVLPAIAAALGVRDTGTQSLRRALSDHLRGTTQLLVLDNMEHVARAVSDVLELISACPEMTVLATSRSSLHIQGEWEYPLSPLDLPEQDDSVELEALVEIEAVALFIERAQLVRPDFRLTADNTPSVTAICRRIDGLPLAIELAAARTRLLPPESLLERLERRLPLLVSKDRDVSERHRTLRATIRWSYDLLSQAEQRLYRTLSVFHGGWKLESAESIADLDKIDVLNSLERLIDQSFVRVHEQMDGTARYSMLETIREFGLEQLQVIKGTEAARRRHARHFLALLEEAESHFRSADEANWIVRLEAEHANLRAALQWTTEAGKLGDKQALTWSLRLAGTAWWFWYVRGHLREARDQLDAVVQLFRDHRAADQTLDDCAQVALTYAKCLFGMGCFAFWTGDSESFDPPMQECREIYRRFGRGRDLALWQIFMGFGAQHTGNFDEAEPLLEEGIKSSRERNDEGSVALGLLGMGEIRLRQRRYADAAAFIEESLALSENINDRRGIAATRATLGAVYLGQGDHVTARTLLSESLEMRAEIGDKGGIAWCLEWLAQVALVDNSLSDAAPMRAARLLSAAKALRDAMGAPADPIDQPTIQRLVHEVQRQLSETAFIAAWEAGRTLPIDEVIEYALRFREGERNSVMPGTDLTRRELDVLKLLVDGRSNQQIADELFISHHTVARHVANIMGKLGLESRTAAATWAMRNGYA